MTRDIALLPPIAVPVLDSRVPLPTNVVDDAPIVSFSELTRKDPDLANRLFAVAQDQVRSNGGSLASLEQLSRRTLAAASPDDATRALKLANVIKSEASREVAVTATKHSLAKTIGTVATSIGEAALYPFLSQAIILGAGVAAAVTVSPWAIIPGAAVLLGQGYASFTYFAKVKGYNFG